MSNPILPIFVTEKRGAICREVLESLPEWFSIPPAIDDYVASADELPMMASFDDAGEAIGFVSVKVHTPFAAELHVIGVKRAWHRRGIGRALVEAAVDFATSQRLRFLTVKTLSASHSDANYCTNTTVLPGRRIYSDRGIPEPMGTRQPLSSHDATAVKT